MNAIAHIKTSIDQILSISIKYILIKFLTIHALLDGSLIYDYIP